MRLLPFVDDGHNLITDITIGQLLAATATLLVIIGLARKVRPLLKRVEYLLDDWFGEEARPGVRERKGVMERLGDQDVAIGEIGAELEQVRHDNNSHLMRVERMLLRHIRESKLWLREVEKRVGERDPEFEVPKWPTLRDDDDGKGEP